MVGNDIGRDAIPRQDYRTRQFCGGGTFALNAGRRRMMIDNHTSIMRVFAAQDEPPGLRPRCSRQRAVVALGVVLDILGRLETIVSQAAATTCGVRRPTKCQCPARTLPTGLFRGAIARGGRAVDCRPWTLVPPGLDERIVVSGGPKGRNPTGRVASACLLTVHRASGRICYRINDERLHVA